MPTFGHFNPAMWKVTTAAGAASATSIAISGIVKSQDVILECTVSTADGTLTEDRTSTTTIDSDGYIKITATTADWLVTLRWLDVSAAEA